MFARYKTGLAGLGMCAVALSTLLPGCGSDSSSTSGPNAEVKIVPPKDAQGKEFPLTGEGNLPAPKK